MPLLLAPDLPALQALLPADVSIRGVPSSRNLMAGAAVSTALQRLVVFVRCRQRAHGILHEADALFHTILQCAKRGLVWEEGRVGEMQAGGLRSLERELSPHSCSPRQNCSPER